MPNLMPSDITDAVETVLRNAAHGDQGRPNFLTAYQILDRLPTEIGNRLIAERTLGGEGAGVSYGAPSVVADSAQMLPGIEIEFIDNRGLQIEVAGHWLRSGFEICAVYRLRT